MTSRRRTLAQDEVDKIVIAHADDLTKWDPPVRVKPREVVVLEFDSKTIQKAKRLAKRNQLPNYRSWLKRIISERIKKEEKGVLQKSPMVLYKNSSACSHIFRNTSSLHATDDHDPLLFHSTHPITRRILD